MNISYTSKLFYGKYAYKITAKFDVDTSTCVDRMHHDHTLAQSKLWCQTHVGNTKLVRQFFHATRLYDGWNLIIYASSSTDRDTIISHFGAAVTDVCQPFDKEHEQCLEVKNLTEVKDRLLYGKYKYVIYFRYDRHRQITAKMRSLLANSKTSKVTGSSWCKVYSITEDDVIMIKLMWPETIDFVKRVMVPTQLGT